MVVGLDGDDVVALDEGSGGDGVGSLGGPVVGGLGGGGADVDAVDGGLVGVVDDAEVEGHAALGRRVREVEMDAAEGASDGGEGDGASRGGGPGVVVEVGSEPFGWGGAEGVEAREPVAEGGEGVGVEGLQPGWDDVGGGSA